jgi:hypothetical protein
MKELADGTQVSPRTYYYLLDFNDRTSWKYIIENFEKNRLKDLTIKEYVELFNHATNFDKEELSKLI